MFTLHIKNVSFLIHLEPLWTQDYRFNFMLRHSQP